MAGQEHAPAPPSGRIPHIVHRVQLGGRAPSAQHERHWQAWQRQLPDWEFRTWQDADLADLADLQDAGIAALLARAPDLQRRAHIACFAILHRFGGVWLSGEMAPYFPFGRAWDDEELVVCNETAARGFCSMGFIAAAPGAQALAWALQTLHATEFGRQPASLETGPGLLHRALAHGSHRKLAPQAFYPLQDGEPISALYGRDLSASFGIRLREAPRAAGQARLRQTLEHIERGDLRAAAEVLGDNPSYSGRPLADAIAGARAQRSALLEAAKDKLAASRVRIDDPVPLAMLKVAFFVLSEIPDLLVWQIGAGDGVTNDPLRPLMVTFDPHAVLVEPNPASFAALQAGYAANTRAMFAGCAWAPQAGRALLRMPDSDALRAAGLAPAAAGFGSTAPWRVPTRRAGLRGAVNRAIEAAMVEIEVDAFDVAELLNVNPGVQPGIVVADMGGSEFDFVQQLLAHGVRPFILQFAQDALAPHEAALLNGMLERDYVLCGQGDAILAYRSDVFSLYCETLYVEYGMPTIYREAFRLLLGF